MTSIRMEKARDGHTGDLVPKKNSQNITSGAHPLSIGDPLEKTRIVKTNTSTSNMNDIEPMIDETRKQLLMTANNNNDCGSNQSGSDSGLGCTTNSISSENTSLVANSDALAVPMIENASGSSGGVSGQSNIKERKNSSNNDSGSSGGAGKGPLFKIRNNQNSTHGSKLDSTQLASSPSSASASPPSSDGTQATAGPVDLNNNNENFTARATTKTDGSSQIDSIVVSGSRSRIRNNNGKNYNHLDNIFPSSLPLCRGQADSGQKQHQSPRKDAIEQHRHTSETKSSSSSTTRANTGKAANTTTTTPRDDESALAKIHHSTKNRKPASGTSSTTMSGVVSTTRAYFGRGATSDNHDDDDDRDDDQDGDGDDEDNIEIDDADEDYDELSKTNKTMSHNHEGRLAGDAVTSPDGGSSRAPTGGKDHRHLTGGTDVGAQTTRSASGTAGLKSCIKSVNVPDTARASAMANTSTQARHKRSVSFNQTVIVFCEEIEASSPSETFEPPPPDYDDHVNGVHVDDDDDLDDHLHYHHHRPCLPINGSNNAQGLYTTDDLEIINKIVGQDASNLTDDQLIGLLENGSLLEGFELKGGLTHDDEFTISRMNSDQSYLCHDAISDSESDSSLGGGDGGNGCRRSNMKRDGPASAGSHRDSSGTFPVQNLTSKEARISSPSGRPEGAQAQKGVVHGSKEEQENSSERTEPTRSQDCPPSSRLEATSGARSSQRSMPARVKVSTFDSNSHASKRNQQLAAAPRDESIGAAAAQPAGTMASRQAKQNFAQPATNASQQQQKVIQTSSSKTNFSGESLPNPLPVRQSNIEPALLSRPMMMSGSSETVRLSDIQQQHQPKQAQFSIASHEQASRSIPMNKQARISDQMHPSDSRQNLINHQQAQQFNSSSSHHPFRAPPPPPPPPPVSTAPALPTSQPPSVNSAHQVSQTGTNLACHICRAIELNRQHATVPVQGDRTKLVTNQDPAGSALPQHTIQLQQAAQPAHAPQNHYHPASGGIGDRNQQQTRPPQPVPSCVSCREISMRQQQQQQQAQQIYAAQSVRMVPASSSPGQQQCQAHHLAQHQQQHQPTPQQQATRPIACQLVYVVDRNGNRIRALQVVGPRQTAAAPGGASFQQQSGQLLLGPCGPGYRFPNPTSMGGPQQRQVICVKDLPMGVLKQPQATGAGEEQARPGADPRTLQRPMVMDAAGPQNENQRVPVMNYAGPRNHTVYYMRQPLGLQGAQSVANGTQRSFPDAHEIRRLDGIRAQPLGNALAYSSPTDKQPQGLQGDVWKVSGRRRDEADDPSFGFSNRPSVKVVASGGQENRHGPERRTVNNHPDGASEQRSRMLAGSQTLDRRGVQRDHSSQRNARENIPSTSSMSNINKTLTNYGAEQQHQQAVAPLNRNISSKDSSEHRLANTFSSNVLHSNRVPGNPLQLKQQETSNTSHNNKSPEVAYVMNI